MVIWIIAALLALAALGILVFYRARRRKEERLQLRLLAGRNRLLSEELAQRLEELERLDREDAGQDAGTAAEALDQLQVLLVERQAHLQNCEELVHLQRRKLTHLAETASAAPTLPPPARPPAPARSRSQAEEQLLRQIEELNKQRRQPPPPKSP